MAHKTEDTGKYSELIARAALLASGWQAVSTSETEEAFDISAKDPLSGEWKTFQVKTIIVREKRGGKRVVQARKNDGTPYTLDEVDYFIGVEVGTGPAARRLDVRESRADRILGSAVEGRQAMGTDGLGVQSRRRRVYGN
nr:hypothetical protein P5643_14050 [Bacillus subtilis]